MTTDFSDLSMRHAWLDIATSEYYAELSGMRSKLANLEGILVLRKTMLHNLFGYRCETTLYTSSPLTEPTSLQTQFSSQKEGGTRSG